MLCYTNKALFAHVQANRNVCVPIYLSSYLLYLFIYIIAVQHSKWNITVEKEKKIKVVNYVFRFLLNVSRLVDDVTLVSKFLGHEEEMNIYNSQHQFDYIYVPMYVCPYAPT